MQPCQPAISRNQPACIKATVDRHPTPASGHRQPAIGHHQPASAISHHQPPSTAIGRNQPP
jgi:hypothetical protein